MASGFEFMAAARRERLACRLVSTGNAVPLTRSKTMTGRRLASCSSLTTTAVSSYAGSTSRETIWSSFARVRLIRSRKLRRSCAMGLLRSEILLQRADAVGHDVDELIDLGRADAEGRSETEHGAPRIDDGAALPGLAVQLGDVAAVQRAARSVGLDEVHAHHEAAPPHLADDGRAAHRRLQSVQEPRAHLLGVLDEVVLLHDPEIRQGRGACDGMGGVRVGVDVLLRAGR